MGIIQPKSDYSSPKLQERQFVLSPSWVVSLAAKPPAGLCRGQCRQSAGDGWGRRAPGPFAGRPRPRAPSPAFPGPGPLRRPPSAGHLPGWLRFGRLVVCCSLAIKGEITRYGKAGWESVTLNQQAKHLKGVLKPELSSAQPEVKHLNPCLGIKINRGLIFKRCGTTGVFHSTPQRL